jgi:hypothetical protein
MKNVNEIRNEILELTASVRIGQSAIEKNLTNPQLVDAHARGIIAATERIKDLAYQLRSATPGLAEAQAVEAKLAAEKAVLS